MRNIITKRVLPTVFCWHKVNFYAKSTIGNQNVLAIQSAVELGESENFVDIARDLKVIDVIRAK